MPQCLFTPDELADLICPACGSALEVTEPQPNDRGDLVQLAFCPACGVDPDPDKGRVWIPRALRTPQ